MILGGVVVAVLGFVAVFAGPKKASPAQHDPWQAVAQRRGALQSESLAPRVQRSMDVRVGHVMVRAELHVDGVGESGPTLRMTARARWAIGRGPTFDVRPQPTFRIFQSAEDIPSLGDVAFHRTFMVSSSDYAAMQYAVTTHARQRLLRVLRRASMTSDGEVVSLTLSGGAASERELNSMLDVVGLVASAGANGLDAFAAMPGTHLTRASGTWSDPTPPELRIATAHGDCTARLRWVQGVPVVWLCQTVRGGFPALNVPIQAGRAPNMPAGFLSEYASRLLPELDGAQLHAKEGTLELRWKATPAPTSLLAGAKLLAELADAFGRAGPFR